MSPPEFSGRNEFFRAARFTPHVAPLVRGADGAARRPYLPTGSLRATLECWALNVEC
jgi:hypothetical protein